MSQSELLDEIGRLSIFQQLDLIKEAVKLLEDHLRSAVNGEYGTQTFAEDEEMDTTEAEALNALSTGSLLDLAGILEGPVSDISEKHDVYIGQALASNND